MPSARWSLVVSLVVVPLTASIYVNAGCLQEPRLCCEGKNNTCRREGARVTKNSSFTCFCDSVCNQLGDCCVDYRSACQAIDCIVDDEWTDWSSCDVSCGNGFRTRSRKIIHLALNGGRDCDPITERVPCSTTNDCHHQPPAAKTSDEKSLDDGVATELAKIIPAAIKESHVTSLSEFYRFRTPSLFDPRHHHRTQQNDDNGLRDAYNDDSQKSTTLSIVKDETPYYAVFELSDVRSACLMSSHWPHWMTKGATVCVDCRALAMHRGGLVGQCKGHGAARTETRWVVITIPGCHGKWVLKARHVDGSCGDSESLSLDFLFT